ncbi:ribonuclease III [Patescibacteria group bacterium]|nr:ribonuclease III [Patescibacteria group bacterium]
MDFTNLEKKINLEFKNTELLLHAFVHRSYLNEHRNFKLDSNERLEFLGDACLELVVSDYLYKKYPGEDEGILTNYRSALVNTASLGETARELGLGEYLLLSRGEEDGGGRDSEHLLANTFEAMLGACYLEAGLEASQRVVEKLLLPKLEHIIEKKLYHDAKSHLQELTQELVSITPIYKILSEWGPDHSKEFKAGVYLENKLIGEGEGNSKQRAEIDAAENALEKLDENM